MQHKLLLAVAAVASASCAAAPPAPRAMSAYELPELVLPQEPGEPLGPLGDGKRTSGEHTHHLAFVFGVVGSDEGDSARWGVEYETDWKESWGLLSERFGVGLLAELDARPLDQAFVAPQLTYHPVPQMRLVLAPGIGLRPGESNVWIVRTGLAWEFELDESWSLGPEVFVDFEEGGERYGVLGLALGFGF